jgi:hypothetical protein
METIWVLIDIAIDLLPKGRERRLLILGQRAQDFPAIVDIRDIPLWDATKGIDKPKTIN